MRHYLKALGIVALASSPALASGTKPPVVGRGQYMKDLKTMQARSAALETNYENLVKSSGETVNALQEEKKKVVALQEDAKKFREEVTAASDKLKGELSLSKTGSEAIAAHISTTIAKGAEITAATADEAAKAQAAYIEKNVRPMVDGVLNQLNGMHALQEFSDLKREASDLEQKLAVLEMRYDQTILGAYVRQKMRSTLTSPEFCSMVQAVVKNSDENYCGSADKPGPFKKAAAEKLGSPLLEGLKQDMSGTHKSKPEAPPAAVFDMNNATGPKLGN